MARPRIEEMTSEVMDLGDSWLHARTMESHAITVLLLVVAAIHLLPVAGVAGAERLAGLYGIRVDGPDLEILMRHRAVLFGLLGAFLAYAAFVPALQPSAFVAAAVSLASFFYLAVTVGGYGPGIRKVVVADVVATIALTAAIILRVTKT